MRLPQFLLLLLAFPVAAFAVEGKFTYPLGPIGGEFRVVDDANYLRVSGLTTGAPGANAGLQVNDFIYGAYGRTFDTLGSDFEGPVRQLGAAIDHAEGNDGQLPLMVSRPGYGTLTLTVELPILGSLTPAYPLTSGKFDAVYEYACAQLHQRVMDDNDGDLGYPTGFVGLALLGHPNWADTTGNTPYRLSIDRIRDVAVNRINNAIYAPVENLLLDGSPNPNYVAEPEGLASWALGLAVMFTSEYYTKTGDANVADEVQRGAELMANRFQWWKQPALHSNGYSPGYDKIAGMVSHGGVTGDYIHGGWGGGINMVGVHLFSGLAMAKRAGADMTVQPKDGHYFGYDTAPTDAVPVGMENYDHTLDEKFEMAWKWFLRTSRDNPGTMDDGSIGYTVSQGGSPYDAGGRVPGAVLGMGVYHTGQIPDPTDADRWERQKGYTARNHDRHMNAHAYNLGGTMFQALAMPYLSDRQQRYILHNWRFYYNFSREPDNTLTFFHARSVNESYQNLPLCVLVNTALPRSVARGGLPHIPGFDTNRLFAQFNSIGITWPRLEARHTETQTATRTLDVDILDASGNVLAPSAYTAAWSLISGPNLNVTFSDPAAATTDITFPESGRYQIELTASAGALSMTEPIDVDVNLASVPTGWTTGLANYEVYTDLAGTAVSDLTSSSKFVNQMPDTTRNVSAIEGDHSGNNYGARLSGYLIPAASGDFTFHISSDDASQFWLSTSPSTDDLDSDASNLTNVAFVSSWTSQYQWDKEANQQSAPISLTAGQRYYYQVLHKEGGGGDHVAVGWTRPGAADIEVIGAPYLAIPPTQASIAWILAHPQAQAVAMGDNVIFSVETEGPSPQAYQWRFNGVPYGSPGADSTLSLTNVGGGHEGVYDCVFTAGDQVLVSESAALTFTDTDFGTIQPGGLWRETYTGIDSGSVSDLKASEKFPHFSDASNVITSAEVPSESVADDFGQRWTGWLVPTETAAYRFFLTADDSAELSLSVDDLEAHKRVITTRSSAVTARQWESVPPSEWITLQSGQRYYLELLAQENGGAEHTAITWQKQGDPDPINDAPPISSPHLEYRVGGTYTDTVPTAPHAIEDVIGVAFNQSNTVDVLANDLDNDNPTLAVTAVSPIETQSGGQVHFSGRTVSYTPATGFAGTDNFTYTVTNSQGLSDTASVQVTMVDVASGLQGWWRLDEESGTLALDVSGATRHGTITGDPTWQTGGATSDLGGSITLDGVDDLIDVGELNGILGQTASLSFWLRTTQPGQGQGSSDSQAIAGYDAEWWQNDIKWGVLDAQGRIGLWLENDNEWAGSTTVVNDGLWRHVVLTRDVLSGEMQVFINGRLEGSQAGPTTVITYPFSTIGRIDSNNGDGAWFNGALDDIRLFDRVLTTQEVQAINAHLPSDLPPALQDDTRRIDPGATVALEVLLNDVDEHWPDLKITSVTTPLGGTVSISSDQRRLSYTAPPTPNAIHQLIYTVEDRAGQTAQASVEITVRPLPSGLAAWWKLDESGPTSVLDSSGNDHHGTPINNVVSGQSGAINGAYGFDGANQRVATPALTTLGSTNTVTITGWVKLGATDPDDWAAVYSNNNGPTLNIKSNRELRYHWESSAHWGWGSGLIIPTDQWVLVAIAVNPDKAVMYLHDGTLARATRSTAHIEKSFDEVGSLGRHQTWSSRHFAGLLDDIRIYDRTLSENEISALHANRFAPAITLTASGGTRYTPDNATFNLSASVNPHGHTIAAVAFYQGLTRLSESTSEPHTLSITDLPLGTYQYTAQVTYGTGDQIDSVPLVVRVAHSLYDTWAQTEHGLPAALANPMDDADRDGITNLLEYAIGGSPHAEDNAMLPRLLLDGGTQVEFQFDPTRTDVNWVLYRSFDMITFTEVYRRTGDTKNESLAVDVQANVNGNTIVVTDPMDLEARVFYELVIEY